MQLLQLIRTESITLVSRGRDGVEREEQLRVNNRSVDISEWRRRRKTPRKTTCERQLVRLVRMYPWLNGLSLSSELRTTVVHEAHFSCCDPKWRACACFHVFVLIETYTLCLMSFVLHGARKCSGFREEEAFNVFTSKTPSEGETRTSRGRDTVSLVYLPESFERSTRGIDCLLR